MICHFHKHCHHEAVVRIEADVTVVFQRMQQFDHEHWTEGVGGTRLFKSLPASQRITYHEHVEHVTWEMCRECVDEFVKLHEVSNAKVTEIREHGRSK